MRTSILYLLSLATAVFLTGCVTPYDPSAKVKGDTGMLVVDGTIADGEGGTIVRLSRTFPVNKKYMHVPEYNATVFVEEESTGATFRLHDDSAGVYRLPDLELRESDRYRLRIQTKSGGEYLSDYESVLVSPPIDSLYWHWPGIGQSVTFYTSTHDPSNSIHHYRWEYLEDWENYAHDSINMVVDWETGRIHNRWTTSRIYCWSQARSDRILLGRTTTLTETVVRDQLLHEVPARNFRFQYMYRLRLWLYPLTPVSYEFWDNLRKNSEDIGDLFGPMPSDIPGNLHCVSNPDEQVIGYVSVCKPSFAEYFIDCARAFPGWLDGGIGHIDCMDDDNYIDRTTRSEFRLTDLPYYRYAPNEYGAFLMYPLPGGSDPKGMYYYYRMEPQYKDGIEVDTVFRAAKYAFCVNCLFLGGTKDKPLDWPNDHQ